MTDSPRAGRIAPDWIRHAVWWQVYPLGFVGAEAEARAGAGVAHRLAHLEAWLDYAVELGASGLALGPVFASSTHGYDTIDHFRTDPRLGDEADFDALVRAAHSRGLRVLLDGVFNHVGRAFPAFAQVLAEGRGAPFASWFRLFGQEPLRPGIEPDYACFEGHRQLVVLNHDEPAVAEYVVRVMNHWLDRGADGWRLDAAYAVPPRFWASVLPKVRAYHSDAYIFGEVIHGDYAKIVTESGLDAVTQYELCKAISSNWPGRSNATTVSSPILRLSPLSATMMSHGWRVASQTGAICRMPSRYYSRAAARLRSILATNRRSGA
jgi:cyclomaltodextrinase